MDRLHDFLEKKSKNILVCVDWANVYNWENLKREGRVGRFVQKVEPKKLFDYLSRIRQIKPENIKLFFGLDKAKESVLDNVVRWIKLKTKEEINTLEELVTRINYFKSREELSANLWEQVCDVLMEYESTKRINEFKKIGFDISNKKDVKTFGNSINDLSKFRKVTSKIVQALDDILVLYKDNEQMKMDGLIDKIKSLKELLFYKVKDRKCDFDVDITVEIVKNLNNFDTFVIFSGDGDFAPAIKYFRGLDKNIVIVSDDKKLGKEIDSLVFPHKPIIIFADKLDIWS